MVIQRRFSSTLILVITVAFYLHAGVALAAKMIALNINSTEIIDTESSDSASENRIDGVEKHAKVNVNRDELSTMNLTSYKAQGDSSDEQTSVALTYNPSASFWSAIRGFWNWPNIDLTERSNDITSNMSAERTFGKIRRLQMALIPIIFKVGVLTAMVGFLVLLGLKTLFLVKLLVLMNAVAILGKFLTLKADFGHSSEQHIAPASWGYNNWSPNIQSIGYSASTPTAPNPSKEIHLHIHGSHGQPQVSTHSTYGPQQIPQSQTWERRYDPYIAYESYPHITDIEAEKELTPMAPITVLSKNYAANHKTYSN